MSLRIAAILSIILPCCAGGLGAEPGLETAAAGARDFASIVGEAGPLKLASDDPDRPREGPDFKMSWPIVKKMHEARFAGAAEDKLSDLKKRADDLIGQIDDYVGYMGDEECLFSPVLMGYIKKEVAALDKIAGEYETRRSPKALAREYQVLDELAEEMDLRRERLGRSLGGLSGEERLKVQGEIDALSFSMGKVEPRLRALAPSVPFEEVAAPARIGESQAGWMYRVEAARARLSARLQP